MLFFKDVKTAVRINTKDGVINDAIALPGLLIFFTCSPYQINHPFLLINQTSSLILEIFRLYLPPSAFHSSWSTWNNMESIEAIRIWQWTRTCSWLYTTLVCHFKHNIALILVSEEYKYLTLKSVFINPVVFSGLRYQRVALRSWLRKAFSSSLLCFGNLMRFVVHGKSSEFAVERMREKKKKES